jgi:hypothetical protein
MGENVSLFREPDAGEPPVRFDEREQETEPSQTGLRRPSESLATYSHRETTATAPVLDSTENLVFRSTTPFLERMCAKRTHLQVDACRDTTSAIPGQWRNG